MKQAVLTAGQTRGQHGIKISVSYALKERIVAVATRLDRSLADTVRLLLRVGLPVVERLDQDEEKMLLQAVERTRRGRKKKGFWAIMSEKPTSA